VGYYEIIVRNTFVERDIAVGIRLGPRARTLELHKVRVPARVCLSKPLLKHRAGVDVPVSTTHLKDTPVELEDARIYFCVRSSVTKCGVVEPINILSYKWADDARMLQSSESEMGWVRQGVTDG
jgi:hypothetical protein